MEFNFKASDVMKHSAAHIVAAAIKRLYPQMRVGVGPVTPEGFYYDIETSRPITEKDFPLIEKNINQIIQENLPFNQMVLKKDDGYTMLLQLGQIYKAELLQKVPESEVSFYKLGEEFIDLCRGPHVKSTAEVGIIKLTNIEKSNWNNDPARPEMQRIKGVVFQNIVEFNEYTEAQKRKESKDFKKILAKYQLGTYSNKQISISNTGYNLINNLIDFIDRGLNKIETFDTHLPHTQSENETYLSLNNVFKQKNWSYKKLPIALRTAVSHDKDSFTSISTYCWKVYTEYTDGIITINNVAEDLIDLANELAKEDIHIEIKTKDLEDPYMSSISNLFQKKIISHNKILTNDLFSEIDIVFKTIDSVGREWSLFTMYIFKEEDTTYYSSSNSVVKTVNFGLSFPVEDIFAYLLSEFELDIPFDLHPQKFICIPKSKKSYEYSQDVSTYLNKLGYTSSVDDRSKSFNQKIRNAEQKNIPFILIIGPKEESNKAVSVRRNGAEIGLISVESLKQYILEQKYAN